MHLMKEEEYMVNEKEVKVILVSEGDNDYLNILLEHKQHLKINFSETDQKYLRNIYKEVISYMLENEQKIKFALEVSDGYDNQLFKDVSKEFIDELNEEIEKVFQEMKVEFFDNKE